MKFSSKVFLGSMSALLLLSLQTGIAFCEEPKVSEPKPEAQATPAVSPNDAVAKVGNTTITRAELDRAVKALLRQNQVNQPLTPDQTKQAESMTVEQLIAAELLYQDGLKLELKDLDKMVAKKIEDGKKKFQTPEEYAKALKTADMDEKDLNELTRKDVVISNLIEKEIAPKATVSEADIKKFYDDNLDKYFKKPESIRASHILIGVDQKASEAEKKKAKEKAEAILKKVKAGEDFAALAKSESTCPSKAQGGDLGSFGRGQMVAPFEQAAFALKPGEISNVVETQFGYHIIKVTEKKEAETIKLEEAKPQIEQYLKNQKIQKDVAAYVAGLQSKIKVEKLLQ